MYFLEIQAFLKKNEQFFLKKIKNLPK